MTSPLDAAVVEDLCGKLTMPQADRLCTAGATVYAPDFFPAISASLKKGVTTYEEAEAVLGPYRYKRDRPEAFSDGTIVFRCWYDLRGDRSYPFVLIFTADGRFYQMQY